MKPKYSNLRRDTAELMKCDCGAERYITHSGVICSAGCPGLTLMGCDLADFRKAWPERAMEYEGDEQTGETKDCPSCNGTGGHQCKDCFGTGEDECYQCGREMECETCYGEGSIECRECEGSGEVAA